MSRITVDMLRAYLMTASMLAMSFDVGIVVAALCFHVPDAVFQGVIFRLAALGALVVCTVAVRHGAMRAFRRGLERRNVIDMGYGRPVLVESGCPSAALVVLYLRFSRREFLLKTS